jgi:hypothetical protein
MKYKLLSRRMEDRLKYVDGSYHLRDHVSWWDEHAHQRTILVWKRRYISLEWDVLVKSPTFFGHIQPNTVSVPEWIDGRHKENLVKLPRLCRVVFSRLRLSRSSCKSCCWVVGKTFTTVWTRYMHVYSTFNVF